jgi:dihydroorotate dehydrogenase electron transfer subunit
MAESFVNNPGRDVTRRRGKRMADRYLAPARVVGNARCAEGFHLMRLEVPGFPPTVAPGQFVHLRLTSGLSPFLRRPFSICDFLPAAAGAPARMDILYRVVGKGTALMAGMQPGTELSLLGPQGRGYRVHAGPQPRMLVGGGVGIPPLHFLARRLIAEGVPSDRIRVLLGARSAGALCLERELRSLEVRVEVATDDGSRGHRGFVTSLLDAALREEPGGEVFACGPTPMLTAVAALARQYAAPCQISLENRMGCALGACRACVWPVRDSAGDGWHYETVCREGPVFDLQRLVL